MTEGNIEAAVAALRKSSGYVDLRQTMFEWAPLFHDALLEEITSGPRPDLGVDILTVPGRCGFTLKKGRTFIVTVGDETSAEEMRFTLAHELGHVLLDSAGRPGVPLGSAREEKLCEAFASRVVARRDEVEEFLRDTGLPTEFDEVKRFANRFEVTLRSSLVILNEFMPQRWPVGFVAATWKPHRKRNVWGIRIDASAADPRFFLPPESRLGSLGFRHLEAFVRGGEIGAEERGAERSVQIPSRRGGVGGWTGASTWTAKVHRAPGSTAETGAPSVLCRIDLGGLSPTSVRPRSRSGVSQRVAPVRVLPGQLNLER